MQDVQANQQGTKEMSPGTRIQSMVSIHEKVYYMHL